MRPYTKWELEAMKLHESFRKRKEPARAMHNACQKAFGCMGYIRHYVAGYSKIDCYECGHTWTEDDNESTVVVKKDKTTYYDYETKTVVCPHCGKKLTLFTRMHPTAETHIGVLTTFKNAQVYLIYFMRKKTHTGEKPTFSGFRAAERWMFTDGHSVLYSMNKHYNARYCSQPWALGSELTLRRNSKPFDTCDVDLWYSTVRVLKEFRDLGYRETVNGTPFRTITRLVSNPHYRTLLEANQDELFNFLNPIDLEVMWPSIKICLRNRYLVHDPRTWTDLITMLGELGKDLHNAYYVCPADLKAAHDKYLHQHKVAVDRKEIEEYRVRYIKEHKKYLDLHLEKDGLTIDPLRTVDEFYDEGNAMEHCVFKAKYYKKKGSLIFSVRENGERLATVEYSLTTHEVVQCRGKKNSIPQRKDEICQLIKTFRI